MSIVHDLENGLDLGLWKARNIIVGADESTHVLFIHPFIQL